MKTSRLSRLREALRARDWLGIAIELAVVTLGVLLAFQIEQWDQQREHTRDERQFLGRLHFEYQRGIDELKNVNEDHRRIMSDIRAAFGARRDPVMLLEFSKQNMFGCGTARLRTAPFNDTAFQELISSGRLNLIADPGLRDQIRDLATAQASLRDRAALGTEAAREEVPYLHAYYRYELAPDGQSHCYVRWVDLFEDDAAVSALVFQYRMHELVSSGRNELIRMTEKVRGAIACRIDKPDCPNR
jgi:hypothetical protein